jgi:hypothetical protein
MKYLKYTPYAYLIMAIFLILHVAFNWNSDNKVLELVIAALFMVQFFVRMHYVKKMEQNNTPK